MGRKRKHDKHLPQRMYCRRGCYYFVNPAGRWLNLGHDYTVAIAEYGRMTGPGPPCVTLQDVIDRYRIHILPSKAKHTQEDQTRQLTKLGKVFGRRDRRRLGARGDPILREHPDHADRNHAGVGLFVQP